MLNELGITPTELALNRDLIRTLPIQQNEIIVHKNMTKL